MRKTTVHTQEGREVGRDQHERITQNMSQKHVHESVTEEHGKEEAGLQPDERWTAGSVIRQTHVQVDSGALHF